MNPVPTFGARSLLQLETCHEDIQRVLNEAIKHADFSVIEGHRTRERQQELYATVVNGARVTTLDGVTKKSQHQTFPSRAVDIIPYPSGYTDHQLCVELGRFVQGISIGMGTPLRWGGDWDSDFDRTDQSFHDLPHLEIR
jgi:peptidoglycan LD-endopeptidase CwlK